MTTITDNVEEAVQFILIRCDGYTSMHKCLQSEFRDAQVSVNYLYRELRAAKVEKEVLPIGKDIGLIPESQLRHIAKLPCEQWNSVWSEVIATAPPKGVTAKHVENTVKRLSSPKQAQAEPETFASNSQFMVGDRVEVRRDSESSFWDHRGTVKAADQRKVIVKLFDILPRINPGDSKSCLLELPASTSVLNTTWLPTLYQRYSSSQAFTVSGVLKAGNPP